MLEVLLQLSGSEYGFIDELNYTPDGEMVLVARAITNIAWNDESRQMYSKFLTKNYLFQFKVALWGRNDDAQAGDCERCTPTIHGG